jgi:curli biogenesis system outer membrane secretion channel CsgG
MYVLLFTIEEREEVEKVKTEKEIEKKKEVIEEEGKKQKEREEEETVDVILEGIIIEFEDKLEEKL